jgi:hypothetical protein
VLLLGGEAGAPCNDCEYHYDGTQYCSLCHGG